MELSAQAAVWFLPFVVPVCLWVAWSDLRTMLIPNKAVLTLVAIFAIVGIVALPTWGDYLWRWSHLAVVLVAGIALNAARVMGAGDAKFMAAAAPFVAVGDLWRLLLIFMACIILGYGLHRLAKNTSLHQMVPGWKSWKTGNRFPMGFPLGAALIVYLALAAVSGPAIG